MKNIVIVALLVCTFSCQSNNESSTNNDATADSAKAPVVNNKELKENVKAGAALHSDSLDPGKTTAEQWGNSGFDNPVEFKNFFNEFKIWIAADKTDSIAAHIQFPLRNCESITLFRKNYSEYFNEKVKAAITNQDPDKFFVNYNGAMAGDGEVWFNQMNGKYVVIAINNKMK